MIQRGTGGIPVSVLAMLPKFAFAEDSDSTGSEAARLHPDDLADIAKTCRVASPWLRAEEAAEYLRCPVSRVRKLTSLNLIPAERDGRRVLYHRDALDAYILAGGAKAS